MFFIQYSYTAPLDKIYNGLRIGFFENRLYGVFADPNCDYHFCCFNNFIGVIAFSNYFEKVEMVIDNEYFDTMDIYNFIWIKDGFCRANGNYFCGFVFCGVSKND